VPHSHDGVVGQFEFQRYFSVSPHGCRDPSRLDPAILANQWTTADENGCPFGTMVHHADSSASRQQESLVAVNQSPCSITVASRPNISQRPYVPDGLGAKEGGGNDERFLGAIGHLGLLVLCGCSLFAMRRLRQIRLHHPIDHDENEYSEANSQAGPHRASAPEDPFLRRLLVSFQAGLLFLVYLLAFLG